MENLKQLEPARETDEDPGPAPSFLAPPNRPDDDSIDRALGFIPAPEPNPAPMPDVHSDTPVALVESAYKALCDAGADLTNVGQLTDIQDQEAVLAKAADELHSLRISLDGID